MTESKWTKESVEARFRAHGVDPGDDSPQAKRRRRIVRAAAELFLKQGYRKTSIEDIARKAEVGKGTVYLHFESKGDLLIHVIATEKQVLMKRLEPLLKGEIPEPERLPYYLELILTSAREMPLGARLLSGDLELFAALEDIGAERIAQNRAEGALWMMELIESAAPGVWSDEEKRARADVLTTLGFFSAMLLDERIRGERSLDDFAATLAHMLTYGVVHRPKPGDT
ncbi:MAG: TetR/AcrR family transcriptional regulator [Myxococcota bacterium]|nr:TetR/AcrR family transcriptional regulator [Myxococcota bacterium]